MEGTRQGAVMQRTYLIDKRLELDSKRRARICPWGDIHYGAKTCLIDKAEAMLSLCLEKHIYVVGMGDLLECAVKDSPGNGIWEQVVPPEEQIEKMITLLTPVRDAGLLLGLHRGNHEQRIAKHTSIDVIKLMCKILGVPYLDHTAFSLFYVGDESYTVHSTHGSAGARLPWSKIRSVIDVFRFTEAECILYGHTHGLDHATTLYNQVDKRRKVVNEITRHAILTGSYLGYKGSYAEEKNLPPVQVGSPIVSLYGDRHEVRVSL